MKLAILDLYDNTPNQGMRAITELVESYEHLLTNWQVYDVRGKSELPDLSYDIYISTGGPGDPRGGDGIWDKAYFRWVDRVWDYNQQTKGPKKYVFFICHSFQMAVYHFKLALVTERKSESFGTFRVHKTEAGKSEPFFQGLPDPFYVADFRHYQAIQPDHSRFEQMGSSILALEKIRPHVALERAVMAIRFSDEMFGTQFHPEADPQGMLKHFGDRKRKAWIIEHHSEEKYQRMMDHLNDPDKILLTRQTILPAFMERAIAGHKIPLGQS